MKTKLLLLITMIILFTSCNESGKSTKFTPKKFGVNKDSTNVESKSKKPKGRPKMIPETEMLDLKNELDSLRKILGSNNTYKRKKNNYVCMFPELSKVLLLEMLRAELRKINIKDEFLTQQFYDFYDLEYTDRRVLMHLDDRISDFIVYTGNATRIDFESVLTDTSNNIIKKNKK